MSNCCQNLLKQLAMNKKEMLISVRVRISSTISLYLRQMSVHLILILQVPIPDEEKNLSEIFIFTFLCSASKDFMKALKAFIKPFEVSQKKCDNKSLT